MEAAGGLTRGEGAYRSYDAASGLERRRDRLGRAVTELPHDTELRDFTRDQFAGCGEIVTPTSDGILGRIDGSEMPVHPQPAAMDAVRRRR